MQPMKFGGDEMQVYVCTLKDEVENIRDQPASFLKIESWQLSIFFASFSSEELTMSIIHFFEKTRGQYSWNNSQKNAWTVSFNFWKFLKNKTERCLYFNHKFCQLDQK